MILIKNKLLQKKLKNYLLEEIQNFSSCQNIGLIKKTNSFAFQSHYNKLKINRIGSLKPRQRRSSSFDKKKSNLIFQNLKYINSYAHIYSKKNFRSHSQGMRLIVGPSLLPIHF